VDKPLGFVALKSIRQGPQDPKAALAQIREIYFKTTKRTIEHDIVPPTANLSVPDPECDLDYTPGTARRIPVDAALCTGSGFGGFQSAIVLAAGERVAA